MALQRGERSAIDIADAIATRVKAYLHSCVRIDTRTLAVFRIGAALIMIAEVLLRARNFSFFYNESGVVPQAMATDRTVDYAVSFYFFTTDSALIVLLMGLHILVALVLLVGYRTRTMTVLAFFFVISLDFHNPLVNSYADTLFRMLLFWAMFLPLGERWSVDSLRGVTDRRPYFVGVASVLALGQMVYMYVRNGIHKTQSEQWTGDAWIGDMLTGDLALSEFSLGAEATPLILGRDDITFFLGEYSHHVTPILELGTTLWFYMMLTAWLLILLRGRWRYPVILLFIGGHATFAVTVRIGLFPYVAMLGLLLFLPREFWEDGNRLLRRLGVRAGAVPERVAHGARAMRRLPNGCLLPWDIRTVAYQFALLFVVVTMVVYAAFSGAALVGLDDHTNEGMENQLNHMASTINVDQPDWSIFAPNPGTRDRYYVFPARTESGDIVDVYNEREDVYDEEFNWERPYDRLNEQYGTYRERFYMNSVRRDNTSREHSVATEYANYLCENWETEDGEGLTHISMWQVIETVTLDSIENHEDREQSTLAMHRFGCDDRDPKVLVRTTG